MADWKDNKGAGPWDFTEQPNKWGYLNNPRWSNRQDSVDFCEGLGLEAGSLDEHKPCGHWHRGEVVPMIDEGKWVAAMQQPGTPYVYVYDIVAKAVIRINTLFNPLIVDGILRLDSAYALDYDMGYGNPGAQRGAYCMNKDGTRIWYLFCDQGAYFVTRGRPDAELVEVDISSYYMKIVKRTLFPGLLPADVFPGYNAGRVNDGCSDDTYTYWCTELIAGRIIKIRNSDHVIVDDHTFNYPIEACGTGANDSSITMIDADKNNEKLYWVYTRDHTGCVPPHNVCRHLVRGNVDFIEDIDDIICSSVSLYGYPAMQNMLRIHAGYILHHRAYHPSFDGNLVRRGLDCTEEDEVTGTDGHRYACIESHIAEAANRSLTGGNWPTYWVRSAHSGGSAWSLGQSYTSSRILQEYLQNILGVKDEHLFTLMHVNSLNHPAFLYCINFGEMNEISRLDVSYYAGQRYPVGYDWDWTSISAMNEQTGRILIFRYHNHERRNYAVCIEAAPSLGFLCDTRFEQIYDDPTLGPFGEPQSWPFEGFTAPPVPSTDPPVQTIDPIPGPGEIPYVPPPPPNDPDEDNVPILQGGFTDYLDVGPGQTLFFKFESVSTSCAEGWQVGNTPQSQEPHTVHLLIKRGSKPTIADFNLTWPAGPSSYDCGLGLWLPTKPAGAEDLYWKYNTGSQAEFVESNEPMPLNTYYIMLYNSGARSVRNQRLTVMTY